jgi:aryl-alcohol dehydrogenase-like predicted oxidoreductase
MTITASGSFTVANQSVYRLGFGAMRITGPGVWGWPKDRAAAVAVLRRAVELGVNFIDTADSYGPEVSEALIAEALHPYADDLVIATKAGLTRQGPDQWLPVGRPEYLRQQCELSIRRLGVEAIDLFQLHRIDPGVPAVEQFGCLAELLAEGKVKAVGLSEVSVEQLRAAQAIVPIATVQNLYNVTNRQSEALLDVCTAEGIGFIPWFPIAAGALAGPASAVADVAAACGATTAQVSLAWLLQRSPVVLPIPGTGSIPHLEENCGAGSVTLSAAQMERLSAIAA